MKKIIIWMMTMLMVVSVTIANAQTSADKKQDRLNKKEQKALEAREMKEKLLALIEDQSFVLEANTLSDRYGNRVNVTANNYIMLDGDRMVIQTAFPSHYGYNGLGGITLNGKLTDYKVLPGDGNKSISITALVNSTLAGSGRVTMSISSDGYTNATFSDNWGNRISFYGYLQGLEDSHIYEGMSI